MKRLISTSSVRINSTDYSIKAGSLYYEDGFSESNVEATESGELVFGEDPTTAIGVIKFELHSTQENLDSIRKFQTGIHSVKIFDPKTTSWSRTMLQGKAINDGGKQTGSDGSFEVTFKGSPLV